MPLRRLRRAGWLTYCLLVIPPLALGAEDVMHPPTADGSFFWVTPAHQMPVDAEAFFKLFETSDFSLKSGDTTQRLPYAIFRPQPREGTKYPLIVWLHGYGDDEINWPYLGGLKHAQLIFNNPKDRALYPFFFLAPQNISSDNWFSKADARGSLSEGDLLIALIHDLVAKNPIDPDRISLVGLSAGGTAAWEFGIRDPGLFAGIAPCGSHGCSSPHLDRLMSVPVWAFHGEGDRPDADRNTISRLRSLGGFCGLTETPGSEHNTWYWAFGEYDLLSWLLAQRKGAVLKSPPSSHSLVNSIGLIVQSYWPHLLVVSTVVGAGLFGQYHFQSRK